MRFSTLAGQSPWNDMKYIVWLPFYLLAYLILERLPVSGYWATQLSLDSYVPFCEWFVIPYCLWYPLLIGVGITLLGKNPPAFRRYMRFLALTFLISELIWFLFPNGQDLRPTTMPRDNLLTALISALYQIDTNTNVFPSVHVVGSVGAALAMWDAFRNRKAIWGPITVLAILICLSTVFIKQHSLLDLFGGLLLSFVAAIPIYHRSAVPRFFRKAA